MRKCLDEGKKSNTESDSQNVRNIEDKRAPFRELQNLCLKSPEKVILGQPYKFLRNTFDLLRPLVQNKVDFFMISESKLDNSIPVAQFKIFGYISPYRFDRKINGGGILLYIREDIPSRILRVFKLPTQGFFVELNLYKTKWLLCYIYNPQRSINPTSCRNFEKYCMFSH